MNGVFLVAKEVNETSHEVVQRLKEKLQVKKAGHAGTLDPLAEGLLVIGVNDATKLLSILIDSDKEYIATGKLGVKTDTADITGEVIKTTTTNFSQDEMQMVIDNFPKEYQQEVPKYSATKIAGKKLYQYARENLDVVLPSKRVFIKEMQLLAFDAQEQTFQIKVTVSKGTYIRALIEDIAASLKANATMVALCRTKQGNFTLEKAKKIVDINANDMISVNELLVDFPKETISFAQIADGQLLDNPKNYDWLFLVDERENPLALYCRYEKDSSKLKPWKMLQKKQ